MKESYSWAEKVVEAIKQIYRTFTGAGNTAWREEALKIFHEQCLMPEDFIKMISEKHLKDI